MHLFLFQLVNTLQTTQVTQVLESVIASCSLGTKEAVNLVILSNDSETLRQQCRQFMVTGFCGQMYYMKKKITESYQCLTKLENHR